MKNIAEILKNCPTGMELDCTIYENVIFDYIDDYIDGSTFPIHLIALANNGWTERFALTREGKLCSRPDAKCVIFPKGKTTWEGFQSFKEGDVLYIDCNDDEDTYEEHQYIFILKNISEDKIDSYCYVNGTNESKFEICWLATMTDIKYGPRFATEEEKEKLFKAIKDNGYKWNAETKTLEKFIEPKFKVGDKIKLKGGDQPGIITQVSDCFYTINCKNHTHYWAIAKQDDWELVPNKFDITTLKPFDKVLVRDTNEYCWHATFYSHHTGTYFYSTNGLYAQCIPFEENKHLLGTKDDCNEFYKNW